MAEKKPVKSRVYLIGIRPNMVMADGTPRLVRASTIGRAERHIAAGLLDARVASQDDLIEYLENGVEVAGEDPDTLDLPLEGEPE